MLKNLIMVICASPIAPRTPFQQRCIQTTRRPNKFSGLLLSQTDTCVVCPAAMPCLLYRNRGYPLLSSWGKMTPFLCQVQPRRHSYFMGTAAYSGLYSDDRVLRPTASAWSAI